MRIAFLTFEYITESTFDGGLANYLRRVSIAMQRRGHSVEIFTVSNVDETIEHDGVIVHRVKPPEQFVGWIRRMTRYYYSHDAVRIIPMALKMRQRVFHRHRQAPFDIVQAPNLLSLGLGMTYRSPLPVVIRASSYQPLWRQYDRLTPCNFSRSTRLIDRIERHTIRRAVAVYAPSELIANVFRRYVRPDVDVIRPPFLLDDIILDSSVYQEHLTRFRYLLFFGTIKVLKGGITLGDALKYVLPRFSDLHIVLVGKDMPIKDAPGRSVMQYILEQAGEWSDRVHHFDRLSRGQLYPIIKGASGVILPSRIDNFPNTCLEAMAFGKVVIGTEGASFEEMMEDGVSGILVPRDNSVALADAMARLWQMSEADKVRIGEAAKARLQPLVPENACRVLEQYYLKHVKD